MDKRFRWRFDIVFFILVVVALGSIQLLSSIRTVRVVPKNAYVFASNETKTYFSPPLIEEDDRSLLVETTYRGAVQAEFKPASREVEILSQNLGDEDIVFLDVRNKHFVIYPLDGNVVLRKKVIAEADAGGYRPDKQHADKGGFIDESNVLSSFFEEKSRWTEDGGWNW